MKLKLVWQKRDQLTEHQVDLLKQREEPHPEEAVHEVVELAKKYAVLDKQVALLTADVLAQPGRRVRLKDSLEPAQLLHLEAQEEAVDAVVRQAVH